MNRERPESSGRAILRGIERTAAVAGCVLRALAVGGWTLARVSNRQAIAKLESQMGARLEGTEARHAAVAADPDQSDWSDARIAHYRRSLEREPGTPMGILRIPDVGLEVAVLAGTDDWTLNRAVGWVPGTATFQERGNVGIAGHRDGFFRALKDIERGDGIEVATPAGNRSYVVQETWIVSPEDVDVLDPTDASAITLVTCYPFYYVGSAPKRFIVRAVETKRDTGVPGAEPRTVTQDQIADRAFKASR